MRRKGEGKRRKLFFLVKLMDDCLYARENRFLKKKMTRKLCLCRSEIQRESEGQKWGDKRVKKRAKDRQREREMDCQIVHFKLAQQTRAKIGSSFKLFI